MDELEDETNIEKAIYQLSGAKAYIAVLFLVCSAPGILHMCHVTAYVFIAPKGDFWCDIPALRELNWTERQIHDVTRNMTKSSCNYYPYDYSQIVNLSREDALTKISQMPLPEIEKCEHFSYATKDTIISEWDLVCDRLPLKATVQMAVALGKVFGATALGWVADRWGRKRAINIGCFLYMILAIAVPLSPYYWVLVVTRILLGAVIIGVFITCFTLLTECVNAKYRFVFGICYNMPYGIGLFLQSILGYYVKNWRHFYFCISIPSVLLLIQIWFLPESPKWLKAKGRMKDNKKMIKRANRIRNCFGQEKVPNNNLSNASLMNISCIDTVAISPGTSASQFRLIFTNSEIRTRFIIQLFMWFTTALTYFVITLSSDTFDVPTYIYMMCMGVAEFVCYLIPVLMLRCMGRSPAQCGLFAVTAVSLFIVVLIPPDQTELIIAVATVGRLSIGGVYGLLILYCTELFPVEIRNTVLGMSSSSANIGSMLSPFIVEMMGEMDRSIPSTMCGILAVMAALITRLLPETRGTDLALTVDEELKKPGRVGFRNVCTCSTCS